MFTRVVWRAKYKENEPFWICKEVTTLLPKSKDKFELGKALKAWLTNDLDTIVTCRVHP